MVHSLKCFSFDKPDHSFWQILVICSGAEFLQHGKRFLECCEVYSPGLRVVIGVWDRNEEAVSLLRHEARQLFATTLYEFSFDDEFTAPTYETALYEAVFWLYTNSKHALLILDIDFTVVEDLTLLPVELQACDIAVHAATEKKDGLSVVSTRPLWLRHTAVTYRFLKNLNSTRFKPRSSQPGIDAQRLNETIAKYGRKLTVGCIPEHYRSETKQKCSRLVVGSIKQNADNNIKDLVDRHQATEAKTEPQRIVLLPLQDIGTKHPLGNNSFSMRVKRLSRPGRIGWRAMAKLLAQHSYGSYGTVRIIPVAQWEVTQEFVDRLSFADCVYVPHKTQQQISSHNAIFYMQEYLPEVFTVSESGWGVSADWARTYNAESSSIDPRLQDFKASYIAEKKTKAEQNAKVSEELPDFDVLAVLQVPEDDALSLHANCTMEKFVADVAKLAATENLKVLLRKHPLDRTKFFERLKKRWQSEQLLFSSAGHVHDALIKAKCVAVINSGVGFEAMLLGKPILAYGQAVYERSVFTVSSENLAATYHQAITEPNEKRIERYDRFLSWFLYNIGYKLDEPILNMEAEHISSTSFQSNPVQKFYLEELRLAKSRAAIVKVGPQKYLPKPAEKIANVTRRTLERVQKNIQKNYYNQAVSQAKSLLIPYFSPNSLSGKRVCLVGNSAGLLESNLAEYIDSHDIVIRMNLGCPYIVRSGISVEEKHKEYVYGVFADLRSSGEEKYTVLAPQTPHEILKYYTAVDAMGTKTSIWSCSTADQSRQLFFAPLFNACNVAPHPSLHHLSVKFVRKYKVQRLQGHYTRKLQEKLSAVPTSGLIWLEFLRQTRLAELNLVGFDFDPSNHIVRKGVSLLEATGKYRHNPERERNYVTNCILAAHKNIHLW